jgi:hypothetical protein
MKVSEILLEERVERRPKTKMDLKSVMQYIPKLHPDIINCIITGTSKTNWIIRGTGGPESMVAFHQNSVNEQKPRHSANTSNEYNVLISEILPSWREYPQRNQSFICTTSHDVSLNFGDPFYVFPLGNPDIGVCSEEDFWNSFPEVHKYISSMEEFNSEIQDFVNLTQEKETFDKSVDKKTLLTLLKRVQAEIFAGNKINTKMFDDKEEEDLKRFKTEHDKIIHGKYIRQENDFRRKIVIDTLKNKDIIKTLDDLLNPEKNKFQMMKYKKLFNAGSTYNDREVWFKGEAIFIDTDSFDEFKYMVTEREFKGKE